ncbi:MAG: dihydroxyacetone kinase subunit DhaK [Bowdeniella nasicola]|nr:dihydroxyacetone kinase subunit DhaK [Bowdeniella nasicola]
MTHLINDAAHVVSDYLEGLALANPHLVRLHEAPRFVARADHPGLGSGRAPQVAVISGGGSGHEPLHCGFVGPGMLHAAVPGEVFTSPPPGPITAAIEIADEGRGALCLVKNYTGDVLNFETAIEFLDPDGPAVESVVIADDVAVENSTFTAGRRGVAGTLVVEKVAGAAAQEGRDLAQVAAVARKATQCVASMGMATAAGVNPATGRASFDLHDGEIEIGIGIHGEPGRARIELAGADRIVDALLDPILADLEPSAGEDVLLFVNGMGATPDAELHIAYRRAHARLRDAGIRVTRSLVGSYVTSLNMAGLSLTVARFDDELTALWDAPCHTPALTRIAPLSGTIET